MEENYTEKFIRTYKSLETLLKERKHCSVLEYENTLDQTEMEKLRICRQMRNYIQHHEDGDKFLTCTNEMCLFIEHLFEECMDNFSGKVQKLQAIDKNMSLKDVERTLMKTKNTWLPVVDDGRYAGVIALSKLIFISSKQNPAASLGSVTDVYSLGNENIPIIKKQDVDNFDEQSAIVIDDNCRYIGVIKY